MRILAPAAAFSFADTGWDTGENFVSLGPISEGLIIERVVFALNGTAAVLLELSAVLSSSSDASEAAFQAGVPLFRSRQRTVSGVSSFTVEVGADLLQTIVVPVGIRVTEGSKWIIFSYDSLQPGNSMGLFSVWVLDPLFRVPGDARSVGSVLEG